MIRNERCWYKNVCSYESCINCIRYAEMKYLMDNSGIPVNKQLPQSLVAGIDLDAYTRLSEIKSDIVNFVKSGSNLYICSKYTGNGKTSWALKLLLRYFDQIWVGNGFRIRGMFVHVPTMLTKLKDFDNPLLKNYRDSLSKADLICWDDIASSHISNYDLSQLLIFIDQRMLEEKANIFTGNLVTSDELCKIFGARLTSRIWYSSEVIEFKGKDRRNGKFADN